MNFDALYKSRIGNDFTIKPLTPRPAYSVAQHIFNKRGYHIARGLFSAPIIDLLRKESTALKNAKECEGVIYEPNKAKVRSIFAPHEKNAVFKKFAFCYDAIGTANILLGGSTYIHQGRINYKASGGSGWTWHSDFETWHCEDGMPDMVCLSMMVAITENTKDNGPLKIIPGSHNYYVSCPGETPENNWDKSLVNQTIGVPDAKTISGIEDICGPSLEVILSPGDALFFHCNLLHSSSENRTESDRTNIFFVYNRKNNRLVKPFAAAKPRPQYAANRS